MARRNARQCFGFSLGRIKDAYYFDKICKLSQKRVAQSVNCDNVATIPKQTSTESHTMNTTTKDASALETLSFVAVVSCILSAAWFLATNFMA